MPHLFGWSSINPKVRGGKDRTETDQSHLGGAVGVGGGVGVPVSLLLGQSTAAFRTPAVITQTLQLLPRVRFAAVFNV